MCEETGGAQDSQRSRRRRRQQEQASALPRRSAIDEPPPVASPAQQWQPRIIQCRSPQYVSTLQGLPSSIATPVVIDGRYYCQATMNGSIHIWTTDSILSQREDNQEDDAITHQFTVETSSPTEIVQLAEAYLETGNLLALSAAGDVYVISIHNGKEPHLVFTWNTETVGASCICCTLNGTIVVGYQNGYLEAWRRMVKLREGAWTAQLLWRGSFDLHHPIRAVEQLVPRKDGDTRIQQGNSIADSEEEANDDSNRQEQARPHHEYLVLTLQPNSPATAKMVEVVDATAMEGAYREIKDINTLLSLERYWVLPEAGMELVHSSTLPHHDGTNGLPRRAHWIPSHGTDCLHKLKSGGCAVGLSDGTVGILSATMVDGRLSWGIAEAAHQLLLSYPCIGLGSLEMQDRDGNKWQCVVCCLRGGTAYLAPIDAAENSEESEALSPLISVSYPHDVDSDTTLQHLQGFVATNIRLGREGEDFPVFFFIWPGGIVDVYASQLLQSEARPPVAVLKGLVENGSAASLVEMLSSIDSETIDPEWKAALEETIDLEQQLTLEELLSDKMERFRSLLLKFADPGGTFSSSTD